MVDSVNKSEWPARPAGEVFPNLLDTTLVAQYLGYDRRGCTPENARRSIRLLVKERGLPVAGKVGSWLILKKAAVDDWLAHTKNSLDDADTNGRIPEPRTTEHVNGTYSLRKTGWPV